MNHKNTPQTKERFSPIARASRPAGRPLLPATTATAFLLLAAAIGLSGAHADQQKTAGAQVASRPTLDGLSRLNSVRPYLPGAVLVRHPQIR
jgi:hypothetical protein